MKEKFFLVCFLSLTSISEASTQIITLSEKTKTETRQLIMKESNPNDFSESTNPFAHLGINISSLLRVDSPSTKEVLEIEEKISSDSVHQDAQSANYLEEIIKGNVSVLRFSYEKKRGYLAYDEGTPLKTFVEQLNRFHTQHPTKEVIIDLSQRFIDTVVISDLYDNLSESLKSKIQVLNLEGTAVGSDITDVLGELVKKVSFKYLVIIGTRAAESAETVSQLSEVLKNKIISIPKKHLYTEEIEDKFSEYRIKAHKTYYKENIFD